MNDTIFALSSGAPPAAIGIIRVSGPHASVALKTLSGLLPKARRATLGLLRAPGSDEPLDRALLLWFPGPATATGEDLAELHCHGGRAVIDAIISALGRIPELRPAVHGEFTRRAFDNGRIDLNAVEGLSDLLAAETQHQRRSALAMAEGHFSRRVEEWRRRLLELSAMTEAALDFSDEDDVPDDEIENRIVEELSVLATDIAKDLARPSAERLRDGIRVALAGPPNAGKSTLLNALAGREAAIVSDIAGTTRDRIEVPVAISGVAFLLTDTAGLRDQTDDPIEAIGMERAREAVNAADILLWLGDPMSPPRPDAILIVAKADQLHSPLSVAGTLPLSALTGDGMPLLQSELLARARHLLPAEGDYALHARQKDAVVVLHHHLGAAAGTGDLLILAEELRAARGAIDRLTGRSGTEDMLDALFSGFCIGK